ncbi:MAG: DUF4097 family beta strand repeat-containing protein [Bacteroidetes bacterium]|nr:DUF4097 family beta strand repeat-containing protein [Bacteroidota bacterium]
MLLLRLSTFVALLICTVAPVRAQTISRVRNGFEVEIEHTFTIKSETSTLEIERYSGDVDVVGGDRDQVIVREVVYVKARNEEEAREKGVRFFTEIEETGDGIRIEGALRYGDNKSLYVELARGMRVFVSTTNGDITVYSTDSEVELGTGNGDISVVRSSSDVEVHSGNGDIDISDVGGTVTASSGAGDITLSEVDDYVDLETGAGDIEVVRVKGSVKAQTGGGDITVEEVGDQVELRTAGGSIEAYRIAGSADLSTAGGSIDLVDIGGNLFASTFGGDIEGNSVGGTISAETLAGDIEFFNVQDDIVVTTEVGDITVSIRNSEFLQHGFVELRADNGDVDLMLPRNTNANVSIDLGFDGEFETQDSPRSLRLKEMKQGLRRGRVRSVKGILNRGGGRIEIRTGSGEVSIDASR